MSDKFYSKWGQDFPLL